MAKLVDRFEYEIKVDTSKADKKIQYLEKHLHRLLEALDTYNTCLEQCKEMHIEFEMVEKKKKWYQFWK